MASLSEVSLDDLILGQGSSLMLNEDQKEGNRNELDRLGNMCSRYLGSAYRNIRARDELGKHCMRGSSRRTCRDRRSKAQNLPIPRSEYFIGKTSVA